MVVQKSAEGIAGRKAEGPNMKDRDQDGRDSMRADEAQARVSGATMQGPGRNSGGSVRGAEAGTAATGQTKAEGPPLMEAVVERSNLWAAYRRVVSNRGAPGVDGLPVEQFADWLKVHWPSVKAATPMPDRDSSATASAARSPSAHEAEMAAGSGSK